jgi:ribosomal protein S18 acetylase RimI-like enzyme
MEQPNFEPKIEILGPEQWREYREIRLKALQTDPTAFGESYEREKEVSEQEIRQRLSNPNYRAYISRIGNKVVALVISTMERPQHVEHMAKIHSVFTDPEFRNKGVGSKLLERVLDDLHKNLITARVALSVNSEQEAARKMYEKLGFVQFGVGHKEMKIGEKYYDQIQMELIFEDKL